MLAENWPYIVFAVGVLAALWLLKRASTYPYHAKGRLLTEAERAFLPSLQAALPEGWQVMMKVRLADVIDCQHHHWQAGWGRFIAAKHIDFVAIEEGTTAIKLCIELDDTSHALPDRQNRDVFVNKALQTAKVPFLRVRVTARYDVRWLQNQIERALETGFQPAV